MVDDGGGGVGDGVGGDADESDDTPGQGATVVEGLSGSGRALDLDTRALCRSGVWRTSRSWNDFR